ncbi:MAG: Gfo/Idh/MocA family oxidoreductase [Trueperaceae bacterium]
MVRHVPKPPTARGHPAYEERRDPLAATGEPLRWGVIATGKIAHTVTAQLTLLEDARLQAVSSRDGVRAAAFATMYGFAASYADGFGRTGFEALAADPDVDVVYVATPHGQHHEVIAPLIQARKHVLVEKAFTVNAREAADLVAMARDRGVFLMEALWTRFLPAYQAVLDALESGEVGEVRYVQADMGFMAEGDARTRLWAPAAGGGALLDLAVYPLAWVVGALGFPSSVSALGRLNAEGVDELSSLSLGYPDGEQAQVLVSFVSDSTRKARIVGTAGYVETDAPLTKPEGFTVTTRAGQRHERVPHGYEPYTFQLREVTRCVQEGLTESPTMPLEDTLRTMRLLDEVRAQLGVRLPNDAVG